MATAGYSGTPLIKKLGISPSAKVILIQAPEDYMVLLKRDISDQLCKSNDVPDIVHMFITSRKQLETEMKKLKVSCRRNPNITIWVSWYKKSSKIPTDITEDVIRDFALKNDLVDVKVCAVSDIWSGLKLVVPVSKR
jgi:hypothetical protein